ncbi:MAG: hypothetical protein V4690_00725 [Patescibacteria group bacterium]
MTEKILSKVSTLDKERVLFWAMLSLLVLCAGFYMYFINSTVYNTVARQNFETEASALALEIGKDEFSYIAKRNTITVDLAYTLGFKDVAVKKYVTRGSSDKFAFLDR